MKSNILSGSKLAAIIESDLHDKVSGLTSQGSRAPGLAVIWIGDNLASASYVSKKKNVAEKIGFLTYDFHLDGTVDKLVVTRLIESLNRDASVDGILLQLPLPIHLSVDEFLALISPEKDVDGLHPLNQGRLMTSSQGPRPCTPRGILSLIDWYYSGSVESLTEILPADLKGKRVVVVGRSRLVGKPVALMLLDRDATVTVVHSRSGDVKELCKNADILVVAAGKRKMVTADWIKPGALVIDVGVHQDSKGRLAGDVERQSVAAVCGAITPVPGGVGPMTVVSLMQNTFEAYLANFSRS